MEGDSRSHQQALPSHFRIQELEVRKMIGSNDIGIKYLVWDHESGQQMAVKEFLPGGIGFRRPDGTVGPQSTSTESSYHALFEQFLTEARALADFQHENVIRVTRVLEANGTAYVVMDYAEGQTLSAMLRESKTIEPDRLDAVLRQPSRGLEALHNDNLLHLDIRPGNIVVPTNGPPVILAYGVAPQEFGAARQMFRERLKIQNPVHSPTIYAPVEQYSSSAPKGPWTDIYSLAAAAYECITGGPPPAAPDRVIQDGIAPLVDGGHTAYPTATLAAIDAALSCRPEDRPQTIAAWREMVGGKPPATKVRHARGKMARTAARGARLPQAESGEPSQAPVRQPRWAVPALVLTAATGLIAYLDTELLRSTLDEVPANMELADFMSPIASSRENVEQQPGPPVPAPPEPIPEATDSTAGSGSTLAVNTIPAGVEVLVDGEFVGKSPLSLTDHPVGTYDITLRHPHFETMQLADQVVEAGEELRIDQSLYRVTGHLRVTTEPPGAWVEYDGQRLVDSTPGILRDLPAGPVQLLIGAPGRQSIKVLADVPKDGTGYFAQSLRVAFGTLTVDTDPSDARVRVPTHLEARQRYQPGMRIPFGSHTVEVSRPGYQTASETVEVAGDTRIEVTLEPLGDDS